MSIHIQHLTKLYGEQRALDAISFTVETGGIVGFLGPNGAGKSTTFKIITGYIPANEGNVTVAGFSVAEQPMLVKKSIGYLPEHNPLYLDMFVHEYLRFVGGLYGMRGKHLNSKVSEMVERCGLAGEQNKKIESLSKGYRQRVGLAQALVHNPKVLILDEPTSGLDPNQLVEIRSLIKEISKDKTVIFSTHIMQEVEALCDRVVIINKGKIVADDTMSRLMNVKQGLVFIVEFEGEVSAAELSLIDGVDTILQLASSNQQLRTSNFKISAKEGVDIRSALFHYASDKQLSLIGLKQEQQSMENIFQQLTETKNTSA
jgi:ABC-2 type transport system ATP-binding protein